MNERIKQLAEQALKSSMVHDGMYRPEGYANGVSKDFADKFAELIVRECSKVILDGQYSDTECAGNSHRISYNNGRYGGSLDIKKHFGIQE